MSMTRRRGIVELHRAFDEARFGPERTLNLRAMRPTVKMAEERAEKWLRERQIALTGDVLVITGRGAQSWDGVSVVRQAIVKLLRSLKRRGVVADFAEHTEGSFVVRLAPISALRSATPRRGERPPVPPGDPRGLSTLSPDTRQALRELALRALDELGVEPSPAFVDSEMLRQFSLLAAGVPEGAERERRLHEAIARALEE
jgi:hypothetical protein